ncbi:MAG TPA: hypothetical protein P5514_02455 [Bacteroidales bacterium]|nr:hypothetical protein [Bacteroidales bacterium]HRX95782.1 hypothetical protein [Bacteroidales bacterium]
METNMIIIILNQFFTNPIIEILKLIGGLAGIAALIWKFHDIRKRYIKLKIEVQQDNLGISVLTEVKNPKSSKKIIDNALLIISPEKQDIISAINEIASTENDLNEIENITDLFDYKPTESLYINDEYAILPLKYFYDGIENIHIADETVTYRSSIDYSKFKRGNYSVRFYVYCESRYPRSSQDLFVIN